MTPKPVATSDSKPLDPRAIANLKHGLTGARLYFATKEEAIAYDRLKAGLLQDLAPENDLMLDLALQIVTDRYRLISAAELEGKIYELAAVSNLDKPEAMVQPETWLKESEKIARIELYASRIQRRYEKNFALYRQLQAERKAALDSAVAEAAELAKLAESNAETAAEALAPAEPFTRRNFDFSSAQIALMVARYRRLNEARALDVSANTAPRTHQNAVRKAA